MDWWFVIIVSANCGYDSLLGLSAEFGAQWFVADRRQQFPKLCFRTLFFPFHMIC